jgi:hypothetical protein
MTAHLDKRRARARREIERMDGGKHQPGHLGGYDNFYQNFRCALQALEAACQEIPDPKRDDIDLLGHALVMFEDLLEDPLLKAEGERERARYKAMREGLK